MRVLLTGVSTRAMAESAIGAGYAVSAVDAFADRDHPAYPLVRGGLPFAATKAVDATRALRVDAAAYGGPFENHPAAVDQLSADRLLLGNPSEVLRRVRDPHAVFESLESRGLRPARVWADRGVPAGRRLCWLSKPRASGGGRGVRVWAGAPCGAGAYLQERVAGAVGSISFVAARGLAVPVAVSRQLSGDGAFGAAGYQYCGSILGAAGDRSWLGASRLLVRAERLITAAADEFGLVGMNGVDFVEESGWPRAIEINPRWCASMELAEWAYGWSLFAAHARACLEGGLPGFRLDHARQASWAVGKAIVYARHTTRVGNTDGWLKDARTTDAAIRDIPRTGERIRAGRPICTVFARAKSGDHCYEALCAMATRVYEAIKGRRGRAA